MSEMTRRGFIGTALAGTAVPLIGAAARQSPNPAQSRVTVESDVVYGKGGDLDLKLDIYRPPAGVTPKRMATIHFHGGGFTRGSKESLAERIKPFAALGYVAIAAQYRLAGQAGYPALVHDAQSRDSLGAPTHNGTPSIRSASVSRAIPPADTTRSSQPERATVRNLKAAAATRA